MLNTALLSMGSEVEKVLQQVMLTVRLGVHQMAHARSRTCQLLPACLLMMKTVHLQCDLLQRLQMKNVSLDQTLQEGNVN